MGLWMIRGGRLVDPANNVDEEPRDLWIEDERVVAAPGDPAVRPDRVLDARGMVILPGGVDMHCHIAGPKVTSGRVMRPELARGQEQHAAVFQEPRRGGTLGGLPSTFVTGYRYAGLGYTTAIEAAVPPLGARQALLELTDTPIIDKGFLALIGNNHYAMDLIQQGDAARLREFVRWLLTATRAYGLKIVNPGGVERWKQGRGNVASLDDEVEGFGVTPRQILAALAEARDALGLPHAIHIHGLNLGLAGNWETTLETMRALDGRGAHFTHIQFPSYGGSFDQPGLISSRVEPLAEYFNAHRSLTLDVGQVLFGETTSMTADGPVGQYLHKVTGRKWISHDVEQETGCGVVPITYEERNLVHAIQWAIGMEWFLRVQDPWRLALSTDHPNGGSFLAYPRIIAMLMDRELRAAQLARLPDRLRERSPLADLDREYSLSEIAVITRAAPAKILGLDSKGHLGPGADADVTIYQPTDDKIHMFSFPRYVIKGGALVIDDGELRAAPDGLVLHVDAGGEIDFVDEVRDWWQDHATTRWSNFAIQPGEFSGRPVPRLGAREH